MGIRQTTKAKAAENSNVNVNVIADQPAENAVSTVSTVETVAETTAEKLARLFPVDPEAVITLNLEREAKEKFAALTDEEIMLITDEQVESMNKQDSEEWFVRAMDIQEKQKAADAAQNAKQDAEAFATTSFAEAIQNFDKGFRVGIDLANSARPLLSKNDLAVIEDKLHTLNMFRHLDSKIRSGAAVEIVIDGKPQVGQPLREKLFNAVITTVATEMKELSSQLVKLGIDPASSKAA